MKKITVLLMAVSLLFTMSACAPTDASSDVSSKLTASESAPSANEWDMTKLASPKSVNSFDIAVLVQTGDPADITNQKVYYKDKAFECGYYRYIGTSNGRHYFYGTESGESGTESFICSCDKSGVDFKKHPDIESTMGTALYNGMFYYWQDDALCQHDPDTKKTEKLINKNGTYSILGASDGWIFSFSSSDILGYRLQDGETTQRERVASGVLMDGKIIGAQLENGRYTNLNELIIYDIISDTITKIEGVNDPNVYEGIMLDYNGDVWVRDYHGDGKNYTLRKIYDSESQNILENHYDTIINGWYYYTYSPEGSENKYIARLNLTSGETEYCKNIDVTSHYYELLPYFWNK